MSRIVALAGVLTAAALAAGCASRSSCAPCDAPCGPQPVWVPPRVQMRTCMEVVPPRYREKTVKDLTLCRDSRPVPTCTPIRAKVKVPITATALVPAYRATCVPEIEYVEVQDYHDRLCPRYECISIPTRQQKTKVSLGVGFDTCRGPSLTAGVRRECHIVDVPTPVAVGQHVVSLPAGTHLEQTAYQCKCVPIHVGADRLPCVIGARLEDRIVGYADDVAIVDRGLRVKERGEWSTARETQPWRYQVVEKRCVVPGFWAYVVDQAPAVREPNVITRAEYREFLKDAQR